MNFKRLALLPFLVAVAPAFITLTMEGSPTRGLALNAVVEIVKIFALVGSLVAASAFDRGDHLRRAWLLHGVCYAILLFRDLIYGLWLGLYSGPTQYLEAILVVMANVSGVTGVWLLSRTWQVAGIELPGSPARQLMVRALGVLVGLTIAGPSIFVEIGSALRGEVNSIVVVVSGITDVIGLSLIVPVMLTAIALRGGLLLWPWGLLTASHLAWLLYDFTGLLRHLVQIEPTMVMMWREIFRAMACTFCLTAGIAQRAVSVPGRDGISMPAPRAAR